MTSAVAAVVFAVAAAGVVVFQIALALGAPWGEYAMGGRFPGRFPAPMRFAAVLQAALIALMAVFVLSQAGLILPQWENAPGWLIWAIVGFSGVSLAMNAITPSKRERRVWVPVAAVMLVSSLIVALA